MADEIDGRTALFGNAKLMRDRKVALGESVEKLDEKSGQFLGGGAVRLNVAAAPLNAATNVTLAATLTATSEDVYTTMMALARGEIDKLTVAIVPNPLTDRITLIDTPDLDVVVHCAGDVSFDPPIDQLPNVERAVELVKIGEPALAEAMQTMAPTDSAVT